MLKAFIFATTIALSSVAAHAEDTLQIKCGPTEAVLSVMKKYSEQPMLKLDGDSPLYIFVNPKTQTWSAVYINETEACVIATGAGLQAVSKKGTSL